MRKQSAALATALFTVFSVAATNVNAQSPRIPMNPGQGAPAGPGIVPGPRAPQPGEGITPLVLSPGMILMTSPDRPGLVLDRPAVIIPQGRVIVREGGILILPQGGQILLGPDTPPLPLPPGLAIVTTPQPGMLPAPQAPGQAVPVPQPHAALPQAPAAPAEMSTSGNTCGVSQRMHDGLAREGEEPLVAGVVPAGRGKTALFILYGNRQSGSWTIVEAERKGNALESCIRLSGDGLKVMPESSRGWGVPVSFTPAVAGEGEEEGPLTLKELEYKLGWKYMQSLQITADSDMGQIRIYANTGSSTFTIVKAQDDEAVIIGQGIDFKGPETLHELDTASRARYQSPAPQSAPAAVPAPAPQ
ncbi:MAG: hypothetical protein LRY54_00255 [Alphaproteobacteria bacterium]|nr:hypothetical protein [Alphaproteobacteria bacterium]